MRLPNSAEARLDIELLARYVEAMTTTKRLTDREMREALGYAPTDALWEIDARDKILVLLASGKTWDEVRDYVERRFSSAVARKTSTVYGWGTMVRIMRHSEQEALDTNVRVG
jgi:hypothetical protein